MIAPVSSMGKVGLTIVRQFQTPSKVGANCEAQQPSPNRLMPVCSPQFGAIALLDLRRFVLDLGGTSGEALRPLRRLGAKD